MQYVELAAGAQLRQIFQLDAPGTLLCISYRTNKQTSTGMQFVELDTNA
jgi:hypothetical protein